MFKQGGKLAYLVNKFKDGGSAKNERKENKKVVKEGTREVVHFQRFGEALEKTKDKLDAKNYYYANPEFDKKLFG